MPSLVGSEMCIRDSAYLVQDHSHPDAFCILVLLYCMRILAHSLCRSSYPVHPSKQCPPPCISAERGQALLFASTIYVSGSTDTHRTRPHLFVLTCLHCFC